MVFKPLKPLALCIKACEYQPTPTILTALWILTVYRINSS